jgi:hypothetical protein
VARRVRESRVGWAAKGLRTAIGCCRDWRSRLGNIFEGNERGATCNGLRRVCSFVHGHKGPLVARVCGSVEPLSKGVARSFCAVLSAVQTSSGLVFSFHLSNPTKYLKVFQGALPSRKFNPDTARVPVMVRQHPVYAPASITAQRPPQRV